MIIIKSVVKLDNSNLLIFSYRPANRNGVSRIFFDKLMVEKINKLIKKNRKLVSSQLVKIVSDFLRLADDFFKVQLGSELENLPTNLIDDLAFILVENYNNLLIFQQNETKDILIITLLNNSVVVNESDWYTEPGRQILKTKQFGIGHSLNVIAFHEPETRYPNFETENRSLGIVKIFIQNALVQFWTHNNDLLTIFSDLKKETIFSMFSFNFNAPVSRLTDNALLNIAQLIHANLATIKIAAEKFPKGLMLQFTYDENEIFNFIKIIRW